MNDAAYHRAYRAAHSERISRQRRARYQPHPRQKEPPKLQRPWPEIHRERKLLLLELAGGAQCVRCGYNKEIVALDFDHRDPSTKAFGISQNIAAASWDRLVTEVQKCQVLCANCHRIKTFLEEAVL